MMQMSATLLRALGGAAMPSTPLRGPEAAAPQAGAHKRLESRLGTGPETGAELRRAAAAALAAGHRAAAIEFYRKALAHAPDDPRLLCELARVLRDNAADKKIDQQNKFLCHTMHL